MKRLAALLVSATLAAGAEAAPLGDYSSFLVFGDSLSDGGNLYNLTVSNPLIGAIIPAVPLPPEVDVPRYWQGRFSDGPVWADLIAAEFAGSGRPAVNMAWGISGAIEDNSSQLEAIIPDLAVQIGLVTPSLPALGPRPLAAVWTGANDVFAYVESGGPAPEAAAAAVLAGIATLIAEGVEDILAFTLPDLGRIPRFAMFQPTLAAAATAAADRFNAALLAGLPALAAGGASIDTVRIDLLFDALGSDPGAFGITELDAPCIMPAIVPGLPPFFTPFIPSPPPAAICADPSGYAFFDANHPSATLHAGIARQVVMVLDPPAPAPVPLPATLPLAVAGTGLLLAFGRRRG